MEIRAENQASPAADRTLKDLAPNVAALLCYVGGWISGIVFLVLEQKNRFIRFHALQSIIVFGILTLAGVVLGSIPVIGIAFHWLVSITGFVLWIILMVKAYSGEYFKMPWAGDLADRLTAESLARPAQQPPTKDDAGSNTAAGSAAAQSIPAPAARSTGRDEFRTHYYSMRAKAGRITGSAFAIAWSIALLIFFTFYHQYIAFYQFDAGRWQIHTLTTSDYYLWLPVLTSALVISIIGHAVLIAIDKYILRRIVELILTVLGIATVVSLLVIFPFDFGVIGNVDASFWGPVGLTVTLIIIAVGMGIGALVNFIQLIVHAVNGKY